MYFNGKKTVKLESGQEMPVVGLGTSTMTDDASIDVFVRAVVELGYRHIDTASVYGSEEPIGKALNIIFEKGIKREDLFITTKLWVKEKNEPQKALEYSLKKLGLQCCPKYVYKSNEKIENSNTKSKH
jgi:2,5-diketo-D-gluconate reductase A